MSILVTCPGCGKSSNAPDAMIGRLGRCKSCGATTEIRAASEPEMAVVPDYVFRPEPDPPLLIVDVVPVPAHKHVSNPGSELGREPWYYRLLVHYAYAIVGLGALAAVIVGAVMGVGLAYRHAGERIDLFTSGFEFAIIALVVASILAGSGLAAAPILLAVDAARKLRLICLQGMVR